MKDLVFTSVARGFNSVRPLNSPVPTPRWAAPEVIRNGSGDTQEADIYSFGMVVIEVSPLTSLRLDPDADQLTICH